MTTITLPQTGTWTIDPAHSAVGFGARHLMAAKVRGSFKSFSGSIEIADSPETSLVRVSIDAASIDSGWRTATATSVLPTSSTSRITQLWISFRLRYVPWPAVTRLTAT